MIQLNTKQSLPGVNLISKSWDDVWNCGNKEVKYGIWYDVWNNTRINNSINNTIFIKVKCYC